jgi:ech hydrogenase subunit D
MIEHLEVLADKAEIVKKAERMKTEGYRLVQVCCTTLENAFEMTYTFDKNYEAVHFRINCEKTNAAIPSIMDSYFAAFTYENEIHDLFGIEVQGLKLSFGGKFYRTSVPTPFATNATFLSGRSIRYCPNPFTLIWYWKTS